jgi:hypothetical protein
LVPGYAVEDVDVTEHSAAEHVKSAERVLGEFLAMALSGVHGPEWEAALSNRVRDELDAVRASERLARPRAPDEANLLGYAGFDQLKAVVRHHWGCCVQNLGLWPSQEWAINELDRLHAIRNPAQHGRTLFPHEFIEGEGIARRLRFEIEELRRRRAALDDHYWLYLEEAEDSLGNRGSNPEASSSIVLRGSKPILMGDNLSLRVRAFDPWGRQLEYRRVDDSARRKTDWQATPDFEWSPLAPGQSVRVDVEVRALGDPHASSNEWDTFASFVYEVRMATGPPRTHD